MSLNFSRQKRLLEPKQFKHVFDSPDKKLFAKNFLLLISKNELDHPRLGLVIGKKNVKLAIDRNNIKRKMRESFRLSQHLLMNYDIVIVARRGLADLTNDELRLQLSKFWLSLSHCEDNN